MPATELDEHSVDGSDLNAVTTAKVADFRSFDMVLSVQLQKAESGKPLDELALCPGPCKALKQFLQHEPGGGDLISAVKGVFKRLDFRFGSLGSLGGKRATRRWCRQAGSRPTGALSVVAVGRVPL